MKCDKIDYIQWLINSLITILWDISIIVISGWGLEVRKYL